MSEEKVFCKDCKYCGGLDDKTCYKKVTLNKFIGETFYPYREDKNSSGRCTDYKKSWWKCFS